VGGTARASREHIRRTRTSDRSDSSRWQKTSVHVAPAGRQATAPRDRFRPDRRFSILRRFRHLIPDRRSIGLPGSDPANRPRLGGPPFAVRGPPRPAPSRRPPPDARPPPPGLARSPKMIRPTGSTPPSGPCESAQGEGANPPIRIERRSGRRMHDVSPRSRRQTRAGLQVVEHRSWVVQSSRRRRPHRVRPHRRRDGRAP